MKLTKRQIRRLWNRLFKPNCFGEGVINMDCAFRCPYFEECHEEAELVLSEAKHAKKKTSS